MVTNANDLEPRNQSRPDLGRITLSVLFIGGLIGGSLWILSPFLGAFIWATMIVVATWPILRRVERVSGGRRAPAVAVMSLGLLAILIVPLGVALQASLGHVDELVALLERLPETQLPTAPEWLAASSARWRAYAGSLEPSGQTKVSLMSWLRRSRTYVRALPGSQNRPAVSRCCSCSSC